MKGKEGGYADFNSFEVIEPRCKGLTRPIPYDQVITLRSLVDNTVLVNSRGTTSDRKDGSCFIWDVVSEP